MSEELKSCPFCGSEEEVGMVGYCYSDTGGHAMDEWHVSCRSCGARTAEYRSEGGAVEVWNRRVERTCRAVLHRVEYQEGVVAHTCSECGEILVCFDFEQDPPKPIGYCPNCGAKVVNE